ncbi:MAG: M48 family metalloprotease [Fibromonadaceae bacterium]|jgi:predicted Zn-dependent protease|nr:M48 family metalloprotease [Fibromonadaceae bacterium]
MSNKWKIFWVTSFVFVVFFQACGMHSWEELLISTTDEKKMGREFDSLVWDKHKDVMSTGEELFSPKNDAQQELYDYYQARGKEIVKQIQSKDFDALMTSEKLCRNNPGNRSEKVACTKDNFFEFKIINSKQINAFAVPGGYVYFYTQILSDSKNGFRTESELSSVLAHEVGHIVLHHTRERMVKTYGASAIIQIFLGDGIAGLLGTVGANFWLLGNSRENEFAADSMGFYYTDKIGISSYGLSDFFDRGLEKDSDGNCKNGVVDYVGNVFSTHPPSCDRVTENKNRIANAKSGQTLQSHPRDKNFVNGKSFKDLVNAAGI